MQMKKSDLVRLLTATQRNAIVAGKLCPQVHSCVLRRRGEWLDVVSLVRDGKTSVFGFSVKGEMGEEGKFVVPDIQMMLGALKVHGDTVTLAWILDKKGDGKIKIASKLKNGSLKQTTLMANEKALAFPTSNKSIEEWEQKSRDIAKHIQLSAGVLGKYTTANGEHEIEAYKQSLVKVGDLKDALSAASMNGQRLGRITFRSDEADESGYCTLQVVVGNPLKGQTVTPIGDLERGGIEEFTIEGGLENVLCLFDDSDLMLFDFFDFTEHDQGYALGIVSGQSWLYQRGVM